MVDVIVIGGGPSGSAVSTWLRQAGLEVALFERSAFPRHHIGESLLAMSMPLLDELGVTEALRTQGFLRKTGSLFRWNGHVYSLGMPFPGEAYQVDRASFDTILLRNARERGVEVHERTLVTTFLRNESGRCQGVRYTDDAGVERTLHASWTVDATGLAQLRSRRTGTPPQVDGPKRVAVSAYFPGRARPAEPHTNSIITEAVRDGWLWFIPLTTQLASVGFVTSDVTPLTATSTVLDEQIASSELVRPLVEGAAPMRAPAILRYTNHVATEPLMRDGIVAVGDAAMFVDPLFSTGVHGALYSARLAASAIKTVESGGPIESVVASWYDRQVRAHYDRVRTMVSVLYGAHHGDSPFWRSMRIDDMSEEEAALRVGRLGPSGAAFFTEETNGLLALPSTLRQALTSILVPPRSTVAYTGDGVVRLRPGVVMTEDLTRMGDLLVPAVRLTNPRNGLTVAYPADSSSAALTRAAATGVTVDLARDVWARGTGADPSVVERFLGTLIATGLLAAEPVRQPLAGVAA
jgi:halogenation protein CepH